MQCTQCGGEITPGKKFCKQCGAPIGIPQTPNSALPQPAVGNNQSGNQIPLDADARWIVTGYMAAIGLAVGTGLAICRAILAAGSPALNRWFLTYVTGPADCFLMCGLFAVFVTTGIIVAIKILRNYSDPW